MKTTITILIFGLVLCTVFTSATTKHQQQIPSTVERMLKRAPIHKLPLEDSTSFRNCSQLSNRLKNDEIASVCSLKVNDYADERVASPQSINYYLAYRLPLSDNFYSLCIAFEAESEIWSVLINYDKQFKPISALTIAYDEIAESAFCRTSKVSPNEITLTDEDWMNEVENMKTYRISPTGKFIFIKQKESAIRTSIATNND